MGDCGRGSRLKQPCVSQEAQKLMQNLSAFIRTDRRIWLDRLDYTQKNNQHKYYKIARNFKTPFKKKKHFLD